MDRSKLEKVQHRIGGQKLQTGIGNSIFSVFGDEGEEENIVAGEANGCRWGQGYF